MGKRLDAGNCERGVRNNRIHHHNSAPYLFVEPREPSDVYESTTPGVSLVFQALGSWLMRLAKQAGQADLSEILTKRSAEGLEECRL